MKFGGWHQCSLIDFPGKICSVFFTEGCSFRCPFCHNPSLVLPSRFTNNPLCEEEVFRFLEKRKGKIDGITITGGEPTLQPDLKDFIKKVKNLGFAIKLDTNGSCPNVVENLLQESLLDYVAMDIKASFSKYAKLSGVPINPAPIEKSIHLLINSKIEYEFRTTIIKEYHDAQEVTAMAKMISGAKKYILQKFRPDVTLDDSLNKCTSYTDEEMTDLCKAATLFVHSCKFR